MFRNIFRTSSPTVNVAQLFLTRNQCLLTGSRKSPVLARYPNGKLGYFASRNNAVNAKQKVCPKRNFSPVILLSGVLTFVGLEKEEAEESELVKTIKKGLLSIKLGQYNKAEKTLHTALDIANQEHNEDGISYVYDVLANLALDTGQNKKAEKLFLNVMQRLFHKGYKEDANEIIHISLKLAKIYELNKETEKAETGYMFCINKLENKVPISLEDTVEDKNTLKLWITALDTYARFLVNQNRAKEAMKFFLKALETSIQVNGKEHEDTALLLSDIGMTSHTLGDLDSALSYAEEAVEIGRKLYEMEHLPILFINLGYLYLSKEMYETSKATCEKGLIFARKYQDEDSIKRAKECLLKIYQVLEAAKK